MTQDQQDPQAQGAPSEESPLTTLPDFGPAQDGEGLPQFGEASGPATLGEPSERSRNRALAITLSVVGASVVVLAILALILSQTVFRSVLEDSDGTPPSAAPRTGEGQDEYVPNPDDPDIAPPPPIFTQAPTTECSIPYDGAGAEPSPRGRIRGGDLEYTIPDGWDFPWHHSALPYMSEVAGQGRNVENNWYSVVNLGKVSFPEDEGGYPGLETAAVAIFQCYATTAGVITTFGENPTVTDYRTEATSVDGYPGWIVQATYHFEDPDALQTSSASIVTAIVVEGPDGPSALSSDVAADHEDHAAGLEEIIASLEVVE
jgi:hypothetical protein